MMIAADNLNVLHPRISEALKTLDPGPLQELARLCEQAGAQYLDINALNPQLQPLSRTILARVKAFQILAKKIFYKLDSYIHC